MNLFLSIKVSDDLEVQSSFMYKKMQELQEKHEEEKDVQRQLEDEIALAFSGFAIYMGKFCYRHVWK